MIYLDNAATTKIHPAVLDAMLPYLTDKFGNPSANYRIGEECKQAIESARHIIASSINANDDEIYFTSGGTESDNTIIKQLSQSLRGVVTTPIEHKAVLNSLPEKNVEYLRVDEDGFVDIDTLDEVPLFRRLVSVMYANNEIGTIQPIHEIGTYIKSYVDLKETVFHTDAVQAYGHIPIDVKSSSIDALSASAHKFHGPKGVGFLYVNKDVDIKPFITGGGQERGFRSGTENVALIVGMAKAAEIAITNMKNNFKVVKSLRDYFEYMLLESISDVHINGAEPRLPGHSNITIDGVNSEEVLEMLNMEDIFASSGSACSAKDSKPSYVLKKIGLSDKQINSSLRFSICEFNTKNELEYVVEKLKNIVCLLRR